MGLAVLSLLAEAAEEQPLLCVVDDAQWLDRASAQALVFVARRLLAESVALVLVTRDLSEELRGLPGLVVEGLRNGDARALLGSAVGVSLDERVRERIVAETRGNPLALLELPRGLTPTELAGGFALPDAPSLSGRIEDSFRRRLQGLSVETQRLLLVAAAEPVGDPVLLWRERATTLTFDPARRVERALAAAQAQDLAGDFEGALLSLAAARAAPLDELGRAHADLLRAEVAFAVDGGGDAAPLLLEAAKQLEPLDVTLARDTYLEAVAAAQFAGRLASKDDGLAVARAALSAPPAEQVRASDFLLDSCWLGAARFRRYAPHTRCSPTWESTDSPSEPGSSSKRPASTPANGPSRRATT